MSSVTLGRDLQRWQWAQPEAESRAATGVRRRFAARTSGEVVAGTDLMVLAFAAVAFAPQCCGGLLPSSSSACSGSARSGASTPHGSR